MKKIENLIQKVASWARRRQDIFAVLLVGSYARGTARADSDMDLMILTEDPQAYIEDRSWAKEFGDVLSSDHEAYGNVTSLFVKYNDEPEIEFSFARPVWANTNPVDAGTNKVISDGAKIVLDPRGILQKLIHAIAQDLKPWDSGILATPEQARAAILSCFPKFEVKSIEFLKAGWDSSAFLVNRDHVFRFPKRPEVEERLRGEIELLAAFFPVSLIPIPCLEYVGEKTDHFPFLFVGYPLIAGTSQTEQKANLTDRELKRLVAFLNTLHGLPTGEFHHISQDDPISSSDWKNNRAKFDERLASLAKISPDLERRVRGFFESYDWSIVDHAFSKSVIHNDLMPEHVLMGRADNITGIIDWGDVAIGDPAIDFAGVGYCFGFGSMKRAIEMSGHSDSERLLKRSLLSMAFAALSDVWYGEHQKERARIEFATKALAALIDQSKGIR